MPRNKTPRPSCGSVGAPPAELERKPLLADLRQRAARRRPELDAPPPLDDGSARVRPGFLTRSMVISGWKARIAARPRGTSGRADQVALVRQARATPAAGAAMQRSFARSQRINGPRSGIRPYPDRLAGGPPRVEVQITGITKYRAGTALALPPQCGGCHPAQRFRGRSGADDRHRLHHPVVTRILTHLGLPCEPPALSPEPAPAPSPALAEVFPECGLLPNSPYSSPKTSMPLLA